MNNTEVLERLKSGNLRFTQDKLEYSLQNQTRRDELTAGQAPFAIVLSCADSRVVPELVFDTGLGELFVVRVAGNIANKSSLASIEYAVAHCGVRTILVLGHESCGAVNAAVAGGDNGENLNHLLAHITPVVEKAGKDADISDVIKLNAKSTCSDLAEKSNILRPYIDKGELNILPAFYNMKSGKVDFCE